MIDIFYIWFWTFRSSMNYDLGSRRRSLTIRGLIIIGTWITGAILAGLMAAAFWPSTSSGTPTALLVYIPTVLTFGYVIPKVVFTFVGKKPVDVRNENHLTSDTPTKQNERIPQLATEWQQAPANEASTHPWEEETSKKSKKPLLISTGILAILAAVTVVITTAMLTGNSPEQATLRICDTWLQQQLVGAAPATDNAENANTVVVHIQSQRPEHCPPDHWNPLVTDVSRDSAGNIAMSFSTTTESAQGTTTTLPSDGAPNWAYDANEKTWNTSPTLTNQPQVSTPPNAVQTIGQPAATDQDQSGRPPTNAATAVPTLSYVEFEHTETLSGQAWSAHEQGSALFHAGNYHGAIAAFKSAKTYHGSPSATLENKIGVAFQATGDHQKAIVHFTNAIEMEDDPIDRVNRGNSYLETEQCSLAIYDAQRALEMEARSTKGMHTDAEAHYLLGMCQTRTGDNTQATIHLKAALALMGAYHFPKWKLAKAHASIGSALYSEGQHLHAIEEYSKAIALDDTASARAGRAAAYREAQDCASASVDAQAALELPAVRWDGYHSGAVAHLALALCYADEGKLHQAVEHAETSLNLMHQNRYDEETIATIQEVTQLLRNRIASPEPVGGAGQQTYTPTPQATPTATDAPAQSSASATTNTPKLRSGTEVTSKGQRIQVTVSGFHDSPSRYNQLLRAINATEEILDATYPAPAVTMLLVEEMDDGFCGNNLTETAARYAGAPYVIETSRIEMRIDEECSDPADTIAHEVAHTWFHGSADWIDEGLANYIEKQVSPLIGGDRPYPPITYCSDYANIKVLEYARPSRKLQEEYTGFDCNYSLGEGLFAAVEDVVGTAELNRRIAKLARLQQESNRQEYTIISVREALVREPDTLAAINQWYEGNPKMQRYKHLDLVEWITPPMTDGQYLHFAGRMTDEGTVFEPILGKSPYCSQFKMRKGRTGRDYVSSLSDPSAVGWKYDEAPEAMIINESIDSTTGYFEVTAKINDQSIADRHDLTVAVVSRVKTGQDGYCLPATTYAQVEVANGQIPDHLKRVKHYHQNEIMWETVPRIDGNKLRLAGQATPGTLSMHHQDSYCGQLSVYDFTDRGYVYVDNVNTILPPNRHWTETPDLEATEWQEYDDGSFVASIAIRNNVLNALQHPVLVIETPARLKQNTNKCGKSTVISAVDIQTR